MGYDGRHGRRSQDTRHYSFHNYGEIVDGDGGIGYRPHTILSPSHNSGEIGISLGFIFMVMREAYIGLRPYNFIDITTV